MAKSELVGRQVSETRVRTQLYSLRERSMTTGASILVRNHSRLRHSSRNLPLKVSSLHTILKRQRASRPRSRVARFAYSRRGRLGKPGQALRLPCAAATLAPRVMAPLPRRLRVLSALGIVVLALAHVPYLLSATLRYHVYVADGPSPLIGLDVALLVSLLATTWGQFRPTLPVYYLALVTQVLMLALAVLSVRWPTSWPLLACAVAAIAYLFRKPTLAVFGLDKVRRRRHLSIALRWTAALVVVGAAGFAAYWLWPA